MTELPFATCDRCGSRVGFGHAFLISYVDGRHGHCSRCPPEADSKPIPKPVGGLVLLETPENFEPRTFEFESETLGLSDCACPHCGEAMNYVTVGRPEVVICAECGGKITIAQPPRVLA